MRSTTTWLALALASAALPAQELRLASFQADVTPSLGVPLCSGNVAPARRIDDPLRARGVVLLGAGKPVVLCSVDFVGIANGAHDAWCAALARAAETDVERVAVHTVHQHDTPWPDFSAEAILAEHGLSGRMFHVADARKAIAGVAAAVRESLAEARRVTHVGHGKAKVERVASNRRLLGPDGKVAHVRYSSSRDPEVRAWPEGTIDPWLRAVSFWNDSRPLAVLSYYACHPQSYYARGGVSADFVGLARDVRDAALRPAAVIHFNGAGGNVACGKYNPGWAATETRLALAHRLAGAMRAAFEATEKRAVSAESVGWQVERVVLPLHEFLVEDKLLAKLTSKHSPLPKRIRAARDLAWARRAAGGRMIAIPCLRLGDVRILHMPGELFVEYQLAAARMAPGSFVCMAAYGDLAPGYIGTAVSYGQGGYETGYRRVDDSYVTRVGPDVERVLTGAMRRLLAQR